MAQYFEIHPQSPQQRLIKLTEIILSNGGLIAYPTDSGYALGCRLDDKSAVDILRRIRKVDRHHNFTIVAADIKQLSQLAKIDNEQFRLIKKLTPGPYTFILDAKRAVPNRLVHAKRKTVGVRLPNNRIAMELLKTHGEPIISSSLILPGETISMGDPEEIRDKIGHQLDAIVDGGICGDNPSTVIDWHGGELNVARLGAGSIDFLEEQ